MDYRQFNLINEKGETYRLTLADRYGAAFLHDVTGMGADETATYQQIGNEFSIATEKINQKTISGMIKFVNSHAYQSYVKFTLFCQHKPLKLYYRTPAGEYWREGIVSKIEKSENSESLVANIDFTATSLWRQPYRVTGTTSVEILSNTKNESGCHIMIRGQMSSPSWTHKVDGSTRVTGQLENKTLPSGQTISAAIGANDVLHIRTDVTPYEIYKTTGSVKTDMYRCSKWNTGRFCLVEYGKNLITCANATSIEVEGELEYETV